jgi:hypothetical protein
MRAKLELLQNRPAGVVRRAKACAAVAAVAFCLAAVGARAATIEVAGASVCSLKAFAIDRDPQGSNIRSAPRADAPVVAKLPPLWRLGPATLEGAEFGLVGSKDGWLLIENPTGDQYDDKKARPFRGKGWISGALVGVTIDDGPLLASPSADAAVLVRAGNDSYDVKSVHSCVGEFVEVTAAPIGGKTYRGWSRRSCASQLTTCDHGSE